MYTHSVNEHDKKNALPLWNKLYLCSFHNKLCTTTQEVIDRERGIRNESEHDMFEWICELCI